jgi:hypothetical protein
LFALQSINGPRPAFDAHKAALRCLGGGTAYLGVDHGLSSLHDMATLTVMWIVLNGFRHGAAVLGTSQVDAVTAATFLKQGIETVAGWLPGPADLIDGADYRADDSTIDTTRRRLRTSLRSAGLSGSIQNCPNWPRR